MTGEDDPAAVLINPIYAISINSDLTSKHEPIVTKERWIKANLHLIDVSRTGFGGDWDLPLVSWSR